MLILFESSSNPAEALRGDAAPGDSSVGSNDIGSGKSSTASPGSVGRYGDLWGLRRWHTMIQNKDSKNENKNPKNKNEPFSLNSLKELFDEIKNK